jgi:hypothetical protein
MTISRRAVIIVIFATALAAAATLIWSAHYYQTYGDVRLIGRPPYAAMLSLHLWMPIFAVAVASLIVVRPAGPSSMLPAMVWEAVAVACILAAALYTRGLFELGARSDNPGSSTPGAGETLLGFWRWIVPVVFNRFWTSAIAIALPVLTGWHLNQREARRVGPVARMVIVALLIGAICSTIYTVRFLTAHINWDRYAGVDAFYGMAGILVVLCIAVAISSIVLLFHPPSVSNAAFAVWAICATLALALTTIVSRTSIASSVFD